MLWEATNTGNERKKSLSQVAGSMPTTARGDSSSQLEGVWTLTFIGPSGASSITMMVRASDGKFYALLNANGQTGNPVNLDFSGGEITLTYSEVNNNLSQTMTLKGRMEGNSMSGKMTASQYPGTEIPFTGTRK